MALEGKKNEGKKKRKGLWLEEQEKSAWALTAVGVSWLLVFVGLGVLVLCWARVTRKCCSFKCHLYCCPSLMKPWTMLTEQHLNTLGLILQESFPLYVNYAQRECRANHKPEEACRSMSGPLSKCNYKKTRGLTFAKQTVGAGEWWAMWRRQGSSEQKRESGLLRGDLELCSSNLAAKGGCFPLSFSGCNSVMHFSL